MKVKKICEDYDHGLNDCEMVVKFHFVKDFSRSSYSFTKD